MTATLASEREIGARRGLGDGLRAARTLGARHLWLAPALGVMLYLMWPTFQMRFGIIDDHEIIDMIGRHERLPLSHVLSTIVSRSNEPLGRFRPGYWVLRTLESAIAGQNPTFWYVDRFLLAGITLVALYVTAVRFMHPLPGAVISLLPFAGSQFETWERLGPNEAYAVPLLTIGIAILARGLASGRRPRQLWPGFLFLALSGFAKENFILVGLLAVGWTALHNGVRRLRKDDWIVLIGAALTGGLDLAAVLVKVSHYGGVYPQDRSLTTALAWLLMAQGNLDASAYLTVGVCLAVVFAMVTPRGMSRRLALELALIAVAFAAAQAAFYAGAPVTGRYLYPLALIPVLAWGVAGALCATPASRQRSLAAAVLLATFLSYPITQSIRGSRADAEDRVARTIGFNQNLAAIEKQARDAGATAIVIQPWDAVPDFEKVWSLSKFLTVQTHIKVMALPATQESSDYSRQLNDELRSWSEQGAGLGDLTPYRRPRSTCLSLVFGKNKPVCPLSAPPPA